MGGGGGGGGGGGDERISKGSLGVDYIRRAGLLCQDLSILVKCSKFNLTIEPSQLSGIPVL